MSQPPAPPKVNTVPIRLSQPENVKTAVDLMEAKLMTIKRSIEELLLSLDAQDKVSWPAFIAKCSSLASDLSTLENFLRRSMLPNSNEDNGEFLKNQLILPHTISPEVNPNLMVSSYIFVENSWLFSGIDGESSTCMES